MKANGDIVAVGAVEDFDVVFCRQRIDVINTMRTHILEIDEIVPHMYPPNSGRGGGIRTHT